MGPMTVGADTSSNRKAGNFPAADAEVHVSCLSTVSWLKQKPTATLAALVVSVSVAGSVAFAAPDKYSVKVPGGLAFAEFRGYEDWVVVGVSQTDGAMAAILANPIMIEAYRAGAPADGKHFPDGSKMAKIHWKPTASTEAPAPTTVPGQLLNVDFMAKDSKRFANSGGWGYAAFNYAPASDAFAPATSADQPPQDNDAKCGFACHTTVQAKDYVFTAYPKR